MAGWTVCGVLVVEMVVLELFYILLGVLLAGERAATVAYFAERVVEVAAVEADPVGVGLAGTGGLHFEWNIILLRGRLILLCRGKSSLTITSIYNSINRYQINQSTTTSMYYRNIETSIIGNISLYVFV